MSFHFFTPSHNLALFKQQVLYWADSFPIAVILDSNQFATDQYARYELLVGVSTGAHPKRLLHSYTSDSMSNDTFVALHQMTVQQPNNWLFGFLGYDLKNELENLNSENPDWVGFPTAFFFVPDIVLAIKKNGQSHIEIMAFNSTETFLLDAAQVYAQIISQNLPKTPQIASTTPTTVTECHFQPRMSRAHYIDCVKKLQQHLAIGDIYEVNFCQEFYAENISINPAPLFEELCHTTQAPFSSYVKLYGQQYLLCASPERFMQKEAQILYSQPIKGTIQRGQTDEEDIFLCNQLRQNPKEQAENVMIVDLVRNDLARCAERKSVEVEELFGVYSFKTVHHLISTIKATLRPDLTGCDALKMTFPMGSMTGAPKIRAMQLIEQYETTRRGLFSGSVGYIAPNGDFDFNVVIRSLLYNASQKYLSLQTGSAITIYADAEQEYAECRLKAAALRRLLNDPDL